MSASWRIGELLVVWHPEMGSSTSTLILGEVTKVENQLLHFKTIFLRKDPNNPHRTTFASGEVGSHYTMGIYTAQGVSGNRRRQRKILKRVIG